MVKPEQRVKQFETNSCVHYYQDRWLPIIGEQLEFNIVSRILASWIKESQLMTQDPPFKG